MTDKRFTLYPYQKQILDAVGDPKTKWIVVVAGRKIGKTLIACETALKLTTHPSIKKILIVEPVEDFIRCVVNPYLKDTGLHHYKTTSKQRSKIIVSTPKSRKHIGHKFDAVIMDDVFFDISESNYQHITSTMNPQDSIFVVLATLPLKKQNPFGYEILKGLFRRPDVYSLKIPSESSPLWNKEFLDESRKILSADAYKSEIKAEFVE
jgi:hypothetical protein